MRTRMAIGRLIGAITMTMLSTASAFAVFTDDASTLGLWHMDGEVVDGSNLVTPDDASGGRPARNLVLAFPVPNTAAAPRIVAGAGPDGSGALEFGGPNAADGVPDSAFAPDVWVDDSVFPAQGHDRLALDLSFSADEVPGPSDNFATLIGASVWALYVNNDGAGLGSVSFYAFAPDASGGVRAQLNSAGGLSLDAWHDVHLEVDPAGSGGEMRLTVDGATVTRTVPGGLYQGTPSLIRLGQDPNSGSRYFSGMLDEVRIALDPFTIPGDFDGNGSVEAADLAQWEGDFGINDESDADNDGDSDGADFLVWQRNLGMSQAVPAATSSAAAVPEPTTAALMLLGVGLVAGLARRRSR